MRNPEQRLPWGAPKEKFGRMTPAPFIRLSLELSLTLVYIKALSKTLPNTHGESHVPAPRLTSTSACRHRWLNFSTIPQKDYFSKIILPNSHFRPPEGNLSCVTRSGDTPHLHEQLPTEVTEILVRSLREDFFFKNHPAKFFLWAPWGKPLLRGTQRTVPLLHPNICICIYSRSHLGWHFRMLFQSSKLKARTSLFTETWQKRRSSFELWTLENVTPSGICYICLFESRVFTGNW